MEITRPRTCNGNYTPRDLYCTPWESCGEGAYRNLLFYCRGVLTVLKSIHPRRGKKNDLYPAVFKEMNLAYLRKFGQMFAETKFKLSNCETFMKYKHSPSSHFFLTRN